MAMDEAPSRKTLEEAPGRVLTFLIGVGKSPVIRASLATRGYNPTHHHRPWNLLGKLPGVGQSQEPILVDVAVRNAVAELDAWDEPNFAMMKAALLHLHPAQAEFLFKDLEPSKGPQAVIGVSTLLDRLDSLDNSPDRKS